MGGRRRFLKQSASVLGLGWIGIEGAREFVFGTPDRVPGTGFRGDAPSRLDAFSRPAAFFEASGASVTCRLCPHECVLGNDDRGFCRARVVKDGSLFTAAYGNLCALNVDPIEKKPLYHFLPETRVVSIAMGGCNLRCPNCQNWEISQARPGDVKRYEVLPEQLVQLTRDRGVRCIAYTYTEPLIYYEYVRDTAARARAQGIRNVLVTAGYVNEKPLRELCSVIDAVTLDVKAFTDDFYRKVSGARLGPVLRTLEVLREEGIWIEVSFLMVTDLSDDPEQVGRFASWVGRELGQGTPLHILRFHPQHKLTHLPPTPIAAMHEARRRAREAGLQFVYLGNVPGDDAGRTTCPHDGTVLVERHGYKVVSNRLEDGACPTCGKRLPGVFEVREG